MIENKDKFQNNDRIQPGRFGKVPIELIEIHPLLLEFFDQNGLKYLSKHPFSENIIRSSVDISKLPVVHKAGKSKVKKYYLTGNLDIYFAALSLANDQIHRLVTVVVDENVSEEAMINGAIQRMFAPIKSPLSCAILAAIHIDVEGKKKDKGFRYSIPIYESNPGYLDKHAYIKDITGFDGRAWGNVAGKEALPAELIGFINKTLKINGAIEEVTQNKGSEDAKNSD